MNASQYSYGITWQYLQSLGWEIASSPTPRGTAACDGRNKKILMKPQAFQAPNVRVRRYVLPHEMWHAVHYETSGYNVDMLMGERSLNRKSAIEVVADAACLITDRSAVMRGWVAASVTWHGKVGYKYSLSDVRSAEAAEVVAELVKSVNNWRNFSREAENLR